MSRSRILSSIVGAALGIALLGACSTESLTERAVGYGLEQAVDGDQDIDFDFGDDGAGGFSISTDEGDFAISFDEDDGGIFFDTEDGEGTIDFDFDGDDGAGSINFNTEDGEGSINFDDDGGLTFESDDGSAGVFGASEPPADWPSEVGVPRTSDPAENYFSVLDFGDDRVISAIFQHAPEETFAAHARSMYEVQGWTVQHEDVQDITNQWVTLEDPHSPSTVTISTDGTGFTAITINEVAAE